MARQTSTETPLTPAAARGGPTARAVLLAGAAGAGLLGVGLGLWARPAMSERTAASVAAAASPSVTPTVVRQVQIVVDDTPAPIGKPIEVLPTASMAGTDRTPPTARPSEPPAPQRRPEALVRVQSAPATVAAKPTPIVALAPKPRTPQIAALLTKAAPPVAAKSETIRQAKAANTRAVAKAGRLAKLEAKAQAHAKARQALVAQAEETRRHNRLASLGHALVRLVPHRARSEPQPVVERVSNHPSHGRKGHSARLLKAVGHPAKAPQRPEPARYAPAPRAARAHPFVPPAKPVGLMKVSNRPRCASPDPGAALVCADPALGAADRQLARAYREAQAAGVSDERLQRQQQRWLAARSAAAREAPWAVRDVYVARIAELNGMAQEAGGGAN